MPGYPCCCVAESCNRWLYFQQETDFEDMNSGKPAAGLIEESLYNNEHVELHVDVLLDPGVIIGDNPTGPASGCNCNSLILSAVLTHEDQCFRDTHIVGSQHNPGAAPWEVGADARWVDEQRRLESTTAANTINVGLRQDAPGLVSGRTYRISLLLAADQIDTLAVFFHGFTPPGLPAQAIIHLDIPRGDPGDPPSLRVDVTNCEAWAEKMQINSPWFGTYRVVIDVVANAPSALAEIEIRAVNSFSASAPPPLTFQGAVGDGLRIFSVTLRYVSHPDDPGNVVWGEFAQFCKHVPAGCDKCIGNGPCSFFLFARAFCGQSTETGRYGWLNGVVTIGLISRSVVNQTANWTWTFRAPPENRSEPFRFGDAVTLRPLSSSDLQRNVLSVCYPRGTIGVSSNNRATMAVVKRT